MHQFTNRLTRFTLPLAALVVLTAGPAWAGTTVFDVPPDLTVKTPLAKSFRSAITKVNSKEMGSRFIRFADGVLVMSVEPSVIRYTFHRKRPMALTDAHQVLKVMEFDPIDYQHPTKTARHIRYQSYMNQATAEVTAWAEIRLTKGKAEYAEIQQEIFTEAE